MNAEKELDISRAPRGVRAARILVEAAAALGDKSERHYLELKGPSDLESKADKAKIAKFILGAANRTPERASQAFEGCAVMIIGINQDGVEGVPPVEMHELEKVIMPYLGADGPSWDVVWVPIEDDSKEVLVVVVEPPSPGQPPFVCRANGDKLQDGRIYLRADGETREATSAEFDQLMKRSVSGSASEVDFDVVIESDVIPIAIDDTTTIDHYISQTTADLLAALPRPQSSASGPFSGSFAERVSPWTGISAPMSKPESRSKPEYRSQVQDWAIECRDSWEKAKDKMVGYSLPPLVVTLANRSETYFHDVQLKIHLEGEVRGVPALASDSDTPTPAMLDLPTPPRRWGPTSMSIMPTYIPNSPHYGNSSSAATTPRLSWDNSGSIDLTLEIGDLRPRGAETSDERQVVLIGDAEPLTTVVAGTWQITARSFNEVFTGAIEARCSDKRDLTAAMRLALRLDNDEFSNS